jgi:hypothetical protein
MVRGGAASPNPNPIPQSPMVVLPHGVPGSTHATLNAQARAPYFGAHAVFECSINNHFVTVQGTFSLGQPAHTSGLDRAPQ